MHHASHPSPTASPTLSQAIRRVTLAGLLVCSTAATTDIHAQQVSVNLQIPAGPLGMALSQFAGAVGVTLAIDPAMVEGLRTPGLQETDTVQHGFEQLLRGTGLVALQQGDGRYALRRPSTTEAGLQLDPTNISSRRTPLETAVGPVDGYVARRSISATKTDTPLVETPQSVSVITRQQIDDQAAQNLSQVLRYTPGLTSEVTGSNNTRELFRIRGFSPYTYQDGLLLPNAESGQGGVSEPYGVERVEVLRGPSSMLYGQNRPGGLINLVSKRPTDTPLHEVQLLGGSHDLKQLGIDLGGPLDDARTLSYRLTGMQRDSGTQVDHVDNDRTFIAPALRWTPSDDTSLTLLAQYQHDDTGTTEQYLPEVGTRTGSARGHIGTGTFLGEPDYDQVRRETFMLGYLFEHRLDDVWTLRQNLRWSKVNVQNRSVFGNGLNATTGNVNRLASDIKRNLQIFNVDNQAQATFATGALSHTLLAGLDYRRQALDNQTVSSTATPIDPYDPVYGGAITNPRTTRDLYQTLKQTGFYLQDQIKLNHWRLTLGGRYDIADSDSHFRPDAVNPADRTIRQDDEKGTWRAALGYLFDNGLMPYVSYSESFDPTLNTSVSATTPIFKPTEGEQYEAGIKYQPPGQESYIAASVYTLKQKNLTTPDPANTLNTVQIGEAETRGFELEGKAALTDHLDLLASYAYTDSEVTKTGYVTAQYTDEGNELPWTPRHQASAWLDYRFDNGALRGLSLGAGARYTGSLWGSSASSTALPAQDRIKTGNVTVFDAAVRYDLGWAAQELNGAEIALNASNLSDKTYVASCQNAGSCYYAPRRSVTATLTYRW